MTYAIKDQVVSDMQLVGMAAGLGKDPYATDPVGIPFCKLNWKSMNALGTSGSHVIRSLGFDLESERRRYPESINLFVEVIEHGVVFLHTSYYFHGENPRITKQDHINFLNEAYQMNRLVLESSQLTLLRQGQKDAMVRKKHTAQ